MLVSRSPGADFHLEAHYRWSATRLHMELNRHNRQVSQSFLGTNSESILAKARIAIIGLSGGGSHVGGLPGMAGQEDRARYPARGQCGPGKNQGQGIIDFLGSTNRLLGCIFKSFNRATGFHATYWQAVDPHGQLARLRFWEQKAVSRCLSKKSVRQR